MAQPIGARGDLIARQFSQAASVYREHDVLQRITAQRLLGRMQACGRLLDIGCGPGTEFSSSQLEQVLALDIAPGMLKQVSQNFSHYVPLCADACALPLSDNSIDTLYSNLALQWCDDLSAVETEFSRVLTRGGECHLAIVVQDSLSQLEDLGFRVNQFESADKIISHFDKPCWQLSSQLQKITVYFDDFKALLYSIKGVGASFSDSVANVRETASIKIRGRQDWLALTQQVELTRELQGLPLSYQILFIRAKLVR
ncbi:methyltransferase domain-containing protein [Shewanella sp. Isolate11]|nr:methyltransferase domain-containing protein [Shewanella sp. Isolate11]MCG9696425.1 methyltransferase domain-containing protein [Shewanella sp. Isolate11]